MTNATQPREDLLAGVSSGQSEDSPSFSVWETELLEESDEEEPDDAVDIVQPYKTCFFS